MNAQITSVRPSAGSPRLVLVGSARPDGVHEVPVPTTKLLARALPRVDWSDAFAVPVPPEAPVRHPQEWADAIFHGPPPSIRALFAARELIARAMGIEPGGRHVFATVEWSPDEVLLGTDQSHLGFRASVLVEPGRVVLSTVVGLRNRRGRAYFAVVKRIHPWVVRAMLTRAARELAVAS